MKLIEVLNVDIQPFEACRGQVIKSKASKLKYLYTKHKWHHLRCVVLCYVMLRCVSLHYVMLSLILSLASCCVYYCVMPNVLFYFVKELESRLGGVLQESFKQCWDLRSRLRLLEVFEGTSSRDLVQARTIKLCICYIHIYLLKLSYECTFLLL